MYDCKYEWMINIYRSKMPHAHADFILSNESQHHE